VLKDSDVAPRKKSAVRHGLGFTSNVVIMYVYTLPPRK